MKTREKILNAVRQNKPQPTPLSDLTQIASTNYADDRVQRLGDMLTDEHWRAGVPVADEFREAVRGVTLMVMSLFLVKMPNLSLHPYPIACAKS